MKALQQSHGWTLTLLWWGWLVTTNAVITLAADTANLRIKEGRYVRLYSDIEDADDTLQTYVDSFDRAMPQWLAHWNQNTDSLDGWRVNAYLMRDRAEFERRGLIPANLPPFQNGYSQGNRIWVNEQPSEYYTLHLLLHEGCHALASQLFGGAGPPWYMEGTAEYLATHHGEGDAIRVAIIPASREASPYWGRIGLICDRRAEAKVPSIETVMRYGDTAHRDVEPYAWSWASAVLMEMYPEYRLAYREAATLGHDATPQFTRQLYAKLKPIWPALSARWTLLCNDMDYGFDQTASAVSLPAASQSITRPLAIDIAANRGWQAVPGMVKRGQRFDISCTGRFQLRDGDAWVSEPNGVTINYYRGRPLGQVIACVVGDHAQTQSTLPSLTTFEIGERAEITCPRDGWLLLKINDAPGDLANNHGTIHVNVLPRET